MNVKKIPTVIFLFFFNLVDIGVSTILFCHGNQFLYHFTVDTYRFNFDKSLFDIWILALLRACILFGLLLSVIRKTDISIYRISKIKWIFFIIAAGICMFSLVKLLAVAEDMSDLNDKWLWFQLAWSFVSSCCFCLCVILLSKIKIQDPSIFSINSSDKNLEDEDERKPLLNQDNRDDSSDTQDEDGVKKGTILRLLSLSKPDIKLILCAAFFLVVSSTGQIFIPYYTGKVVDGIVIDKSQKEFTSAIIIMACISAGSSIAGGIRGGCFVIVNSRLNIRIRNMLFGSIMDQEIGFFDSVKTGDITSRLTSDTTAMSDTLGLNSNIFLRNLIKTIGVVFFMFKLSWRLSLVTVIGLPIVFAVSNFYGKYYEELSSEVQDSLAKANDVAEEACSSVRTVRSFANEDGEKHRYNKALQSTYKLNKKMAIVYAGYVWCIQIFELGLTVAVLYYGGHLVITNRLSGGTLVSFILYQLELGGCIEEMGDVYTGLMQASGASEKVFEYIDRIPKVQNLGQNIPSILKGYLQFDKVSFSYPTRPDNKVLKDISFSVKPGEVVALVGPSGGGKTSCINLIEHFYEPVAGNILLDSIPIQEYDHKYLHRKISLVGQEPVLYARTVKENISYGLDEDDYDFNGIQKAAEMANAHHFISEMKEKYETQTGEKGVQMSGGQKQRIAIARALIRNPSLLLLDEATSALDSESEHVVQQAMYQNLKGRTVIIIAHRLSTVERADRIIVIDKGTIAEQGSHKELLQREGLYAKLVQRQLLGFEDSDIVKKQNVKDGNQQGANKCQYHDSKNVGHMDINTNRKMSPDLREENLSGGFSFGVTPKFHVGSSK